MKIHIKIVGFHDIRMDQDICLHHGILIKDLVDRLSKDSEMFRTGMEKSHIVIMINGVSTSHLQGTDTPLKDGDDLLMIPMQFGG